MIARRVITALLLAPVIVLLTLTLSEFWFGMLLGCILIGAAWEWHRLRGGSLLRFGAACAILVFMVFQGRMIESLLLWGTAGSALIWGYLTIRLVQNGLSNDRLVLRSYALGVALLCAAWSAMILLHGLPDIGPAAAVALLCVVWAADTGAFFSGRAFGKRKLAPDISPNKTVEGVVGGMLGALLVLLVFGYWVLQMRGMQLGIWTVCGILAAAFSVAGDLYQSRLKRISGVKDSGSLLPGHGGILDRIDGAIAALPIFVTSWFLLK